MSDLQEARPGSPAVFLSYSLPAVAGTLLSSCAVVIDGLFVGRFVGPAAIAAVNLTMPLLYLYLAVSVMISVGGANLAARLAGAGRGEEASRVFSGTIALLGAASIAISAAALVFIDPLLALLGAKGEALVPARDYLSIMLWFYFVSMLNIGIGAFFRSGGKPFYPLMLGLVGNAIDIFLDWLFIVDLGMAMRGAALSSAIGALAEAGLGIALLAAGKSEYRFVAPRLARAELKTILSIGSAEFIGQISITIVTYIYNAVLMGSPRPRDISTSLAGSFQLMTASTTALAVLAGFWDLKMPEPTKQPSDPIIIMKDGLENTVRERTRELSTRNGQMLFELKIASRVQMALLPHELPFGGKLNIVARMAPSISVTRKDTSFSVSRNSRSLS